LPTVSTVEAGSAAEAAGFRPGDEIFAAAGTPVTTFDALRPILQNRPGAHVSFEIMRQGATINLTTALGTKIIDGRKIGYLGVSSRDIAHQAVSPARALEIALVRTWQVITDTASGIAGALSTGRGAGNFAGMLEVAHLAGQAAMTGIASLLVLTAVLSVNLALMNLLPIPVLDGGAFLFTAIEWVRGKPASPRILDFATRSGVAVIATMFFASTLHDLAGFGLFHWLFSSM
jgi:regulator of sigma E protease